MQPTEQHRRIRVGYHFPLMSAVPHIPEGFCPKCGYAIDPGQCFECGAQVSESRLLLNPREFQNRRRDRRAIAVLVLLFVFIVAHQFIVRGVWLRMLPAGMLISMQSSNKQSPTSFDSEIYRRITAGEFSRGQIIDVLDAGIQIRVQIDVRDGHPEGQPWRVRAIAEKTALVRHLESMSPFEGFQIEKAEFSIDEKPVSPMATVLRPAENLYLDFALPGMAEGLHDLAVAGTLTFRASHPPISYERKFSASKTVQVSNRLCLEHSVPTWSPELGEHAKRFAQLSVMIDRRSSLCLHFSLPSPQFDLVGELQYRIQQDLDWRPVGTAYERGLDWLHLGESESGNICSITVKNKEIRDVAVCRTPIDFRWIPDACAACTANVAEHFSGTIEWIGVEVPVHNTVVLKPATTQPTRVIEYKE